MSVEGELSCITVGPREHIASDRVDYWSPPNTPAVARCLIHSAPGFNTGAHYPHKIEESSTFRSTANSICVVANGQCAAGLELRVRALRERRTAFGNSGTAPAALSDYAPTRTREILRRTGAIYLPEWQADPDALAKLRAKYDTVQLAALTPG